MASSEGFLTEEQRERLTIATQNSEVLSSSPKSPSSLLSEHQIKAPAGGKGAVGVAARHVRRTHSGKLVRVKKGKLIGYYPTRNDDLFHFPGRMIAPAENYNSRVNP